MRTYYDCIPCLFRQTLDSVRLTTNDECLHEQVMRQTLDLVSKMDFCQSPPAMAQKIHTMIRKLTGIPDPYLQIKNSFNKLALKMYPELKNKVKVTHAPLETALRLAVAGNIIDFGANSALSESQLEQAVAESLTAELDMKILKEFGKAVTSAKNILYLADNAGEIVFDRLLIEQLHPQNITLVVKAGPIINDATIKDARTTGLTDIVNVIDNGSDAPGTILERCSDDFRRRFKEADLIIAKGQGNYETLHDIDKNIFFILRAKCPIIARYLGCEIGSLVLVKNQNDIGNQFRIYR